jgi:hypothetical protein
MSAWGTFSAIKVGEATLIEMHASSYQVSRSWADIANAPSDSLCIYQQLDGENWFDTGRHGEFVIAAGALGTSYSDLPYVTTPTKQSGFHLRLLKIPFARCKPMVERNQELPAQLLNTDPGLAALFSSYFAEFVIQAPHLKGASAEARWCRRWPSLPSLRAALPKPAVHPARLPSVPAAFGPLGRSSKEIFLSARFRRR